MMLTYGQIARRHPQCRLEFALLEPDASFPVDRAHVPVARAPAVLVWPSGDAERLPGASPLARYWLRDED
jgi:hypothetical protein